MGIRPSKSQEQALPMHTLSARFKGIKRAKPETAITQDGFLSFDQVAGTMTEGITPPRLPFYQTHP
jgi:hypothetical protein